MSNIINCNVDEEIEDINEKIQEFASLIEKSNYFTFIIEGGEDYTVYEPLESFCDSAPKMVDILPVNGRSIALGVFNKLKDTPYIKKVAFIVDQDTWVHIGKPAEYNHERIICTTGYSIENDIFIDRKLTCLMKSFDVYTDFESYLTEYLRWYVLAIERVINDTVIKGDSLDIHPNQYFKQNKKDELILLRENEVFSECRFKEIFNDFAVKLRGKNLLDLFDWSVNNRIEKKKDSPIPNGSKQAKSKKMPPYNSKLIMEETPRTLRGENLNRIFDTAQSFAMQGF
ncbi:hypothetical protein [Acinetobacter venetianus]|uniref:hypothetical protein n=1 Tax=Acinetobacter venetianus TaxID=52133 RepID=UPI002898A06E|nr:hypothetical protein [Acinetobacter venetianus]